MSFTKELCERNILKEEDFKVFHDNKNIDKLNNLEIEKDDIKY